MISNNYYVKHVIPEISLVPLRTCPMKQRSLHPLRMADLPAKLTDEVMFSSSAG
jgi:hypothetical protein